MGLEKKLKFVENFGIFLTIMSGIYLLGYVADLFLEQIFIEIDTYIGFLPSIFDQIFPMLKISVGDREISLGYFLSAFFCFGIYAILSVTIISNLKAKIEKEKENTNVTEYIEKKKEKNIKERQIIHQVQYKETFYGLLEFKLQYLDNYERNSTELEKLKFQYNKLVVNKLKTQYPKVDFIVQDKVFFISDNYSLMHLITVDLLKILNVIVKTNKFNAIKVSTLLSYWVDSKSAKKMSVFRTLSQINALDNENKIIIPVEVYMKIMSFGREPWCQAASLGQYRLFNAYNGEDADIELYKITSVEPKETF